MKLTQDWFEQQEACLNGLCWARTQFSDEVKEIEATEIINRLIAQKSEIAKHYRVAGRGCPENSLHWANRVICRVLSKEQRIKYAIFAAEQVIHIYEEWYPNDSRPREAIEAAKKYLEDPSTVRTAADAAYAAASVAAYAATSSAAYTAADAAYAAAYIAYAVADDSAARASNAAADASNAAADKMRERILKYGLELLQA